LSLYFVARLLQIAKHLNPGKPMNENFNKPKPQARPQLLTVLCILSFFGGGMGAISSFTVFMFYDIFIQAIESASSDTGMFNLEILASIDRVYFLLNGLLMVISFTGVMQMWGMKKAGFHLYALSQLMVLIVSTIYIYKPMDQFPMFDLLLTSLFILLYLRFRNIMN
jgi:hypothetical protein